MGGAHTSYLIYNTLLHSSNTGLTISYKVSFVWLGIEIKETYKEYIL